MQYGLTIETEALLIEKAKQKKDGVYQMRGVGYRVRNRCITHFSADGKVLERAYGFNCIVGTYDGYNSNGVKKLKDI